MSICTGPRERPLRRTLMAYSSPVMKLRDSANRSAGASTNISSGLASDSGIIWGDGAAMRLWSSREARLEPCASCTQVGAMDLFATGHGTLTPHYQCRIRQGLRAIPAHE